LLSKLTNQSSSNTPVVLSPVQPAVQLSITPFLLWAMEIPQLASLTISFKTHGQTLGVIKVTF
jgi:hypothetical protein